MALARLGPVSARTVTLERRSGIVARLLTRGILARLLTRGVVAGWVSPRRAMMLAHGIDTATLGPADVIVSAGRRTMLANIALARGLNTANVFAGSLRGAPAEAFAAVLLPYAKAAGRPRHLVTLKPAPIDPDAMRQPSTWPDGRRVTLVLGGPSTAHRFLDEDWAAIAALIAGSEGLSWRVVTSPRTPPAVADQLARTCAARVDAFIDFRRAGPGSITDALDWADAIVCTEDSSSMIAEAIATRRPVVALQPGVRRLRADEADMLDTLEAQRRMVRLPLATVDAATLDAALSAVVPLRDNPLDILARALAPLIGWDGAPPPDLNRPGSP
jgi:mitochondrial fission protein ELM1